MQQASAFYIITFMYGLSVALLFAQVTFAAPLGLIIPGAEGSALYASLYEIIDIDQLNSVFGDAINPSTIDIITNLVPTIIFTILPMLTGSYVFIVLAEIGVPFYFIIIVVIMYVFILLRTIANFIRGI